MDRRILHCYADYKWTGPSEPVVRLCVELRERGWGGDLACMYAPDGVPNALADGARALDIPTFEVFTPLRGLRVRRLLHDRRALHDLVGRGAYDLIHCHGGWDHFVAGWRRHRTVLRAIPLVRSDHAAHEYTRERLHRRYYGPLLVDHLTVLSDRCRTQAVDRLRRDPATVTTVRGAVDAEEFSPMEPPARLRGELGLSDDDVVIGLVARVQRHRRFEVLLQAADLVRRQDGRVKIVVCGRGTHKERILDRPTAAMALQDTVISAGYRRDDYREVLATFDAGLMLVPGSDGSCRAALQMAAMEKPLIVARRGVLPDIVRDGETGIVVVDDPANLAEAMLEVAADPERRRQWGRAARRRMQRLFNPGLQAEQIIGVYEGLLSYR